MVGIQGGMLSSEINPSYTTGDLAMQITQNQINQLVNQMQSPLPYSTWCVVDNDIHNYVLAFDTLSAREAYIKTLEGKMYPSSLQSKFVFASFRGPDIEIQAKDLSSALDKLYNLEDIWKCLDQYHNRHAVLSEGYLTTYAGIYDSTDHRQYHYPVYKQLSGMTRLIDLTIYRVEE